MLTDPMPPTPGADTAALVQQIASILKARGQRLVSAESCTGGLVAAACTDLSGSSDWFERGWVTYSNSAKTELLGVPADLIAAHGAVSEAVARAMAVGALAHAPAHWALAITGIAGPSGGSADKPVGTVWLGWATPAAVWAERHHFSGDRAQVRQAAVRQALGGLVQRLTLA